jgi:hypothetical protein
MSLVKVGDRSLFHTMVVEVTVISPLMLNVPKIAEADRCVQRPDSNAPKSKALLLLIGLDPPEFSCLLYVALNRESGSRQ